MTGFSWESTNKLSRWKNIIFKWVAKSCTSFFNVMPTLLFLKDRWAVFLHWLLAENCSVTSNSFGVNQRKERTQSLSLFPRQMLCDDLTKLEERVSKELFIHPLRCYSLYYDLCSCHLWKQTNNKKIKCGKWRFFAIMLFMAMLFYDLWGCMKDNLFFRLMFHSRSGLAKLSNWFSFLFSPSLLFICFPLWFHLHLAFATELQTISAEREKGCLLILSKRKKSLCSEVPRVDRWFDKIPPHIFVGKPGRVCMTKLSLCCLPTDSSCSSCVLFLCSSASGAGKPLPRGSGCWGTTWKKRQEMEFHSFPCFLSEEK